MTIKSIEIHNYRSIEKAILNIQEIDNKKCFILLGRNETGKSNILKAISLIDENIEINYNLDCNKNAKKDSKNIEINYMLDFDKKTYENRFEELDIPKNLLDAIHFSKKVIINSNNEINRIYYFYLNDRLNYSDFVVNEKNIIIKTVEVYKGDELLTEDNINFILPNFKLLSVSLIQEYFNKGIRDLFNTEFPKIIFWQHSHQYLINEAINLANFKEDTSLSIPLRNIFYISGINQENIKSRIEQAEQDEEYIHELSEILSEEATKYINSVWKEHKINIKVIIESTLNCFVNIEDQDYHRPKYKMDQRSDGFKQFISILLNLSAENKASILKNKLILLDEPEVHLHPSGIKYLRDELLEISNNNTLFISTHSVHMVDRLNLSRHYKITKEKSITNLYQIQENNPYEEEVIYESLGTSIYEHISPNMIIFEGKTDKDIFDEFSKKFRTELKIKNISAISSNGVEKIPKYIKFFNGELVKGFVVVDSDKAGKTIKEQIISENKQFSNNTFEINDLVSFTKDTTLEDLLPKEVIETILKKDFELEIELDINKPFIEQIKKENKTLNEKELKINILKYVVSDIHKSSMTKEKTKEKYLTYFKFIKALYEKINS
ncbi:AAA family ATPase [Aliarcobacter butzleri]|uniref:AAA family ATPase n=1 Tax=Aliarcobacter butzleri TaxID=28197 RepID=UPI001EDC8582|nr:AAA family ATPase [Aliarcobacter butzleri]MCG3677918.1 AAA family ATPase [Aliarcobacter butzleri]